MHRKTFGRMGRWAVCVGLLWSSQAQAHEPGKEMVAAAKLFVASLDDAAKAQALFEFKSDKREFWHFVPDKFIKPGGKRYGLMVGKMTGAQRNLAMGLLSSGLSHKGYQQTMAIMTLEQILHDMENKNPIRNPSLYYVSIFGKPSLDGAWAWRYEGHHLSLNFVVIKGKVVSVTPSFFGSNPATVKEGPYRGTKVLAGEEDLARQLVKSLSDEQKAKAVVSDKAPRDILTGQDRKADKGKLDPGKGIKFEDLKAEQQALLIKLINEYAIKYRPEIIEGIDQKKKFTDGKGMVFAWAGSTKPFEGHYYRIQSNTFLFEYACTQNGANHVHAAWRDFDGDFGNDLLQKHFEQAHKK